MRLTLGKKIVIYNKAFGNSLRVKLWKSFRGSLGKSFRDGLSESLGKSFRDSLWESLKARPLK